MICSGFASGVGFADGAGWVAVDADGEWGADWAARLDEIEGAGIDAATNRTNARMIALSWNGRMGWSLNIRQWNRERAYTTIVMQRDDFLQRRVRKRAGATGVIFRWSRGGISEMDCALRARRDAR